MRIVMFYHTLLSDWNHGNAHFLRGVATELISRGHEVRIFEPTHSWSYSNLVNEHGGDPIHQFHAMYPTLKSIRYNESIDLGAELEKADLVVVHEWNSPDLVAKIGAHRRSRGDYVLLFHDTHHRMVTAPEQMSDFDLRGYDGVLAYGKVLRDLYLQRQLTSSAWTWHEAADTRVFHPIPSANYEGDLVWIGNWGDDERTSELYEFLIAPVKELGLKARVYGVRYPNEAKEALAHAGIEYAGWLPNFDVPKVFSRFKLTIHVPRRPYVERLPGIPTIRPFEALACGIPLICSPWKDTEGLFNPGKDYLVARSGDEMKLHIKCLLKDSRLARSIADHGVATIQSRHTCRHRVTELLKIFETLRPTALKKRVFV